MEAGSSSETSQNSSPASAMHPTIQLIVSRRSVRSKYLKREVPDNVVLEIVRCGLAAPSSKNARPWRLHIVTDRELLADLALAVANADGADTYVPRDPLTGRPREDWPSSVAESATTLASVPLAIFIENLGAFSRGRDVLASVSPANLRGSLVAYAFELVGIGAALMNMWTAANALGAQAVFMGDVCVAEHVIASRLGLQCDLVGVLAVGYSEEEASPQRVRYDVTDASRVLWHGRDL